MKFEIAPKMLYHKIYGSKGFTSVIINVILIIGLIVQNALAEPDRSEYVLGFSL